MGREYIRVRSNAERKKWLDRAKEALNADSDSEAIKRALRHTAQSAEAMEEVKREISPEVAEEISTDELRVVMYPQIKPK